MKPFNHHFSLLRNYVIFAITFFTLHSCKPEDAPQNPCANAHKVSASFLIQEDWATSDYGATQWEYYDTDTLCTYRVKLIANEDGASYRWHIGTDTIVFTQKSFTISFKDYLIQHPVPQNIQISLVVSKDPNKRCFPNDDGIDTFTRTIHIINATNGTLIKGHFLGYWDGNPSDTSTVYLRQGNFDTITSTDKFMYAYNLSPKFNTTTHGYGDYTYDNIAIGYREIICSVNAGAFDYNTIRLNADNTVAIVGYDFFNNKVRHFNGIKISDK